MKKRFHGLRKVKFRASWNKHNLYNLSRLKLPQTSFMTYYQQKWASKSITRAYHGEFVREGQWERMFSPHLNAVIPMDHKYLAEHDGSELAAGRGSGKDIHPEKTKSVKKTPPVPYMSMTYAPIERRLDMAIWRALFASSARQARQFVVHGQVKVNGKKMQFPGYLLNPGDMFQVEPDRVLFATGFRKELTQIRTGRKERKKIRKSNKKMHSLPSAKRVTSEVEGDVVEETSGEVTEEAQEPSVPEKKSSKSRMDEINALISVIDETLNAREQPSAKQKVRLRELHAKAKELRSKASEVGQKLELDKEISNLTVLAAQASNVKASRSEKEPKKGEQQEQKMAEEDTEEYKEKLAKAIQRIRDNPVDPLKPYATPWRPRPYMSPFAFIPRYLEVSHKICSAVYLRHPVARPGLAEVPTPFPPEIQQLAFNWYLRRR